MFILNPFVLSSELIRPLRLEELKLTSPLASNLVRQKLHDRTEPPAPPAASGKTQDKKDTKPVDSTWVV